jgi:hypothetical protein
MFRHVLKNTTDGNSGVRFFVIVHEKKRLTAECAESAERKNASNMKTLQTLLDPGACPGLRSEVRRGDGNGGEFLCVLYGESSPSSAYPNGFESER